LTDALDPRIAITHQQTTSASTLQWLRVQHDSRILSQIDSSIFGRRSPSDEVFIASAVVQTNQSNWMPQIDIFQNKNSEQKTMWTSLRT